MILEGFVDFRNYYNHKNLSLNHFEKYIKFERGYIAESGFNRDLNNSFIIGVTNAANESFCESNFLLSQNDSFAALKEKVRSPDEKLCLGIWFDEAKQRLSLTRELFGSVPLFYIYIPDTFFIFSTSILSLIKNKDIEREFLGINISRVVSYCNLDNNNSLAHSANTFFSSIKSAPAGHLMTVTNKKIDIICNVTFRPEKWAHINTIEETGHAFFNILKNSVHRSSSDESQLLASHLSGGLDSSSISSMLRFLYPDRPLHTLYSKSRHKDSDESEYSIAVAEKISSLHHEVFQSKEDFSLIKLHTSVYGEPETAFLSPSLITTMMQYASSLGCTIIIDGSGGDSVVGNGMEIIQIAFRDKQWNLVKRLLKDRVPYFAITQSYPQWNSYSVEKKYQIVLQYYNYSTITKFRNKKPIEIYRIYKEISDNLGVSLSYFAKKGMSYLLNSLTSPGITRQMSMLKDDLIESTNITINSHITLTTSLRGSLQDDYQNLFDEVFNPSVIWTNERLFALSNHYGISSRSPMHDKDLFEFCLSVPNLIKYGGGKGREHFREAMKNLLPEKVLNRTSKATLSSAYGQEITLRLWAQAESFVMDSSEIWNFVDKKKLLNEISILKNDKITHSLKLRTWFHITRTVSLALWLEWRKEIVNS